MRLIAHSHPRHAFRFCFLHLGIGKKNFKPFVRFNLSWLMHLAYAVFWVSIIGPILYRNKDTAQ
jgi:hypothetical protein